VETLDDVELPETGEAGDGLWASGALAPDNNIYYMPYYARRIMKLNADNDTCSSVGDNLGGGYYKYRGTVVAYLMAPDALPSLTQPILTQHLL
jgi:hypothetical protein